jgi:hypothetical protein
VPSSPRHIALTSQVPHTTEQLLRLSDIFGPHIAHGQSLGGIVFEHDRMWHSVVISGIQMPKGAGRLGRRIHKIGEELHEEMLNWNPRLCHSLKNTRLLCREEDLLGKERGSLLVSFEDKTDIEHAIQEGVFMFGECCRVAPYRPQRKSYSHPDLRQGPSDSRPTTPSQRETKNKDR